MQEVIVTPVPATANVSTGVITAFDHFGQLEPDVEFTIKLTNGPGIVGQSHDTQSRTFTSDANGIVNCTQLVRGASYTINRSESAPQTFVVPDVASFIIPVTGLLGFEADDLPAP